MSILDIVSRVLVSYKGDTTDLKAKIKELKGEEKALAAVRLKGIEDSNKATDGMVKRIGEYGKALQTVSAIATRALEFEREAVRNTQLVYAAKGLDIEKLRVASHGLVNETQLLTDAARLSNGMIKASADEMASAERAIVSFTRKGFEQAKAHDAVLAAVTLLKTDGLDDLGIHIDKSGLSMDKATDRAKIYQRVMLELAKAGGGVKDGQDVAGEGVEAAAVSMDDSFTKLRVAIGQMVISLTPMITKLAEAVAWIAKLANMKDVGASNDGQDANSWDNVMRRNYNLTHSDADTEARYGPVIRTRTPAEQAMIDQTADLRKQLAARKAARAALDLPGALSGGLSAIGRGAGMLGQLVDNTAYGIGDDFNKALASTQAGKERAKQLAETAKRLADAVATTVTDALVEQLAAEIESDSIARRTASVNSDVAAFKPKSGWDRNVNSALGKFYGAGGESSKREAVWSGDNAKAYGDFQDRNRESFLERTFGKKEEFDQYRELFGTLTGAVTAAYAAWVDGSMSAGDAAKLFLKQSLAALGQRMLIRGLEEFAEGVASLAIPGGQASATAHFTSAALFGAGAAAAGLASKAISAPGGGSSSAPNVSGSAGSRNNGGPSGATIVIGDSFADDSPRMRGIRARELVDRALGSGGGRNE